MSTYDDNITDTLGIFSYKMTRQQVLSLIFLAFPALVLALLPLAVWRQHWQAVNLFSCPQETAILCTESFCRVASSPECTAMSLSLSEKVTPSASHLPSFSLASDF